MRRVGNTWCGRRQQLVKSNHRSRTDEGGAFHDIAGLIGRRLNLPVVSESSEEGASHFDWIARFVAMDSRASSHRTGELLGFDPKHPGLIADIDRPSYFES